MKNKLPLTEAPVESQPAAVSNLTPVNAIASNGSPRDIINRHELARLCYVCPGTIDAWRKHGLPYIAPPGSRLILFSYSSVLDWLKRQQRGGAA